MMLSFNVSVGMATRDSQILTGEKDYFYSKVVRNFVESFFFFPSSAFLIWDKDKRPDTLPCPSVTAARLNCVDAKYFI